MKAEREGGESGVVEQLLDGGWRLKDRKLGGGAEVDDDWRAGGCWSLGLGAGGGGVLSGPWVLGVET